MIVVRDLDWDEDLMDASRRDGMPRARVYRPSRVAVVLGRGSSPELEVNVEIAQSDGIPLLRRRGGGCSVVLDTGNVVAACVLPLPGLGGTLRAFGTISAWIIEALEQAGVPDVRQAGISDLALGDRKIGGACIYRTKGLLYYTTTLLFQPDIDLVERYLKPPPREPDYRAGRTHRAFMGSLAGSLPSHDIESFADQLKRALSGTVEHLPDLNPLFDGQQAHSTFMQELTT